MKTYQSHKIVQAARIVGLPPGDGSQILVSHVSDTELKVKMEALAARGRAGEDVTGEALAAVESVAVPAGWMAKHQPKLGGYLIVYPDGYQSYSPANAFENGYVELCEAQALPRIDIKPNMSPEELAKFRATWEAASVHRGDLVVHMVRDGSTESSEAVLAGLFGFGETLPQKILHGWLVDQIATSTFEVRRDKRTTVCEMTLRNGATYRGESTCAVEAEYDQKQGEFLADKDALSKAWAFYGVLLRELRHRAGLL